MKREVVTIQAPEGSIMAWLLKPRFQKHPPVERVKIPRTHYTREQKERGLV